MKNIKEIIGKNIILILYIVEFLLSVFLIKSTIDLLNTKAYCRIFFFK